MIRKKRMQTISTKNKDPLKMEGFRSYIGKDVISKSGERIGRVYDMVFTGGTVAGIIIMRRLSKMFIDREFLRGVSAKAVTLSIDPVTMILGKQVFDADGKKLGKVAKLIRKGNSNALSAIIVKKRLYSKGIKVPREDIEVSKKNIILRKAYE